MSPRMVHELGWSFGRIECFQGRTFVFKAVGPLFNLDLRVRRLDKKWKINSPKWRCWMVMNPMVKAVRKKQNTFNTSKSTSVHEASLTASSLFKTCGDQGFQWSTVISTGWFREIQKVPRLRPRYVNCCKNPKQVDLGGGYQPNNVLVHFSIKNKWIKHAQKMLVLRLQF